MPVLGGWQEQTAAFAAAVSYCDRVCAAYHRREKKRRELAEEASKQFKQFLGQKTKVKGK